MNWQEYITQDPAVLLGKPVIRGTRISVELLLELLESGWTHEQIFEELSAPTQGGSAGSIWLSPGMRAAGILLSAAQERVSMFLANENFPAPSISLLRKNGLTVFSIREASPGISDEEVVAIAQETGRIILTFDKDYGEIIFRHGLSAPPAVIFFRTKGAHPEWSGERLLEFLDDGKVFASAFSIVEHLTLRQRVYT